MSEKIIQEKVSYLSIETTTNGYVIYRISPSFSGGPCSVIAVAETMDSLLNWIEENMKVPS